MLYHSTRNSANTVDSAQAVLSGLAPDGGLYVPKALPTVDVNACLQENSLQMAARIIGAMLPDIPNMEELVNKAYLGKFQTEELTPTVDTGKFTVLELQELWGEQFETYYEMLQEIIAETPGETLQYQGEYIYAAYHQSSAGNTRSMSEYYEKSDMPYLAGVACHEDTTADGYLNVFYWTGEEFVALCKNVFPEENISGGSDILVLKRDVAGYALEVRVGQTVCDGETFRKKLNLPSACFEITFVDEDVRIVTMGQGHGFGLSQHMAGCLAESGKKYQEILQYFYEGVSIVKER